jgi:hypothetical protein
MNSTCLEQLNPDFRLGAHGAKRHNVVHDEQSDTIGQESVKRQEP